MRRRDIEGLLGIFGKKKAADYVSGQRFIEGMVNPQPLNSP
jgi:hypothetical protein